MSRYAYAYVVALAVLLVLEAIWLGIVARSFYFSRMASLLADHPRWGAAAVYYALYVVGLVYFAVSHGLDGGGVRVAALNGALFGFFTYLTYSGANLAVLKGYDPIVAVVDTCWGTVLGAAVAGTTVLVLARLA